MARCGTCDEWVDCDCPDPKEIVRLTADLIEARAERDESRARYESAEGALGSMGRERDLAREERGGAHDRLAQVIIRAERAEAEVKLLGKVNNDLENDNNRVHGLREKAEAEVDRLHPMAVEVVAMRAALEESNKARDEAIDECNSVADDYLKALADNARLREANSRALKSGDAIGRIVCETYNDRDGSWPANVFAAYEEWDMVRALLAGTDTSEGPESE